MKYICLIVVFFLTSQNFSAQEYHQLCFRDTSEYGDYISRTLHLLSGSTKKKQNEVNIIVYGQSVSKQKWSLILYDQLQEKFPYAKINMVNKSVGGFSSQKLWKTCIYDILPFYPDLVIFHVFGSHTDYDTILKQIRGKTSAEILVWNDPWQRTDKWADTMSYHLVPSFCEKYGIEFANIRSPWVEYLATNSMNANDLLSDGAHLNDAGNKLLADLLLPYFRPDNLRETDPFNLIDTIYLNPIESYTDIKLDFDGNRIDLFYNKRKENSGEARILIDDIPPSSHSEISFITRPNADPDKDWPWQTGAVYHITGNTPLTEEDWTLEITDTTEFPEHFKFRLFGSLSGFDGSGNNSTDFVSLSEKVIINKDDWFLKEAIKYGVKIIPGYSIKWQSNAIYSDFLNPSTDPDKITLVQGLHNKKHTLKILSLKQEQLEIEKIVIYKPFLLIENQ